MGAALQPQELRWLLKRLQFFMLLIGNHGATISIRAQRYRTLNGQYFLLANLTLSELDLRTTTEFHGSDELGKAHRLEYINALLKADQKKSPTFRLGFFRL